MNHKRVLAHFIGWELVLLLVAGCGAPPVPLTPAFAPPTAPAPTLAPTTAPIPTYHFSMGAETAENGYIASQALANNLIGDPATREYWVYLPPGYNTSDKRYPVVYVLHGYTQHPTDYVYKLDSAMNQLLDSGEVRQMILVFPDANNRLLGSWYMSSPTIGDYESYITKELVAQIDATYRTLPNRESRGITGCSMGGFGSLHLALKYPDVFSVAAPMSGMYDWAHNYLWEQAQPAFTHEPKDWSDFDTLDEAIQMLMSLVAVAASNPDKPPFYMDMPFKLVDTKPQIVPEVYQKVNALDPVNDLRRYLNQPIRLRSLMIYQDTGGEGPEWLTFTEAASRFEETLTEMGVEHDYVQVTTDHCTGSWTPILKLMDAHLAH